MDGGGWNTREDVRGLSGVMVNSVGWMVKERKRTILLVASAHASGYSGDVCIPKGCIISKLVLTPTRRSP
jgi:hypothetical protein